MSNKAGFAVKVLIPYSRTDVWSEMMENEIANPIQKNIRHNMVRKGEDVQVNCSKGAVRQRTYLNGGYIRIKHIKVIHQCNKAETHQLCISVVTKHAQACYCQSGRCRKVAKTGSSNPRSWIRRGCLTR